MELSSDLVVISAFGRGHWLAAEMAKRGVPVMLLDVTDQMGPWAPEDREGPFGFLRSSSLKDSQERRLRADGSCSQMQSGLTLWLADGPLEMRGAAVQHRLKSLGVAELVQKYLAGETPLNSIRKLLFDANWLAHFAHSFATNVWTPLPESFLEGQRQEIFSEFYLRDGNPQRLESSLNWCEEQGVKVHRGVEIKDVSWVNRKTVGAFEIRFAKPGLLKGEQFVWCLSPGETGRLGEPLKKHFFPQAVPDPDWIWIRYRLRLAALNFESEASREQIPAHAVLIRDLLLPWVDQNFLILRRTEEADLFDAWIRIPHQSRFHKQDLIEKAAGICREVGSRIPDLDVQVIELPREAELNFSQLGPSCHPIYSRAARHRLRQPPLGNVNFDSPEQWDCLGWSGSLAHQDRIFQRLEVWWNQKEDLRKKREARELARRRETAGREGIDP